MPVCLNIKLMERLLAFLDMACARLSEFVKKESQKRDGFDSATEATGYTKVNKCFMEMVYHIKTKIELEELNITHTLYKKMIELIQRKQQEIRGEISILLNENKIYALELQKRKERVEEIGNKHAEFSWIPEKPETPIQRLHQGQEEPVIFLQEKKFGFAGPLQQEVARSTEQLQQEQVKSTQYLQQEIKHTLQTLHEGFEEITRQVQQNAEVSLQFLQRNGRRAWKKADADIVQLKQLNAETTEQLQQEQTESSLHLQQLQVGLATCLQHGQEAPTIRLQQDQEGPTIHLPQNQSELGRRLLQAGQAITLRQKQVRHAIHSLEEQAGPVICLHQEQAIPGIRLLQKEAHAEMPLQQEAKSAMHLQQEQAGPIIRLPQDQSVQKMIFEQDLAEFSRLLAEEMITRCIEWLQHKQVEIDIYLQKDQARELMHLRQEQTESSLHLQQLPLQQEAEAAMHLPQEKAGWMMRLPQEQSRLEMIFELYLAEFCEFWVALVLTRLIEWLQHKQVEIDIYLLQEQAEEVMHLLQEQAGEAMRLQQEQAGEAMRLQQDQEFVKWIEQLLEQQAFWPSQEQAGSRISSKQGHIQ